MLKHKNRLVALGTLGAMTLTTLGGTAMMTALAEAKSKNWKKAAIGAAAVGDERTAQRGVGIFFAGECRQHVDAVAALAFRDLDVGDRGQRGGHVKRGDEGVGL